ncbi:MAG: hypothetical protein M1831_004216 [Alyxoria varia]|nr:MAG: hypothetical protein M1831_004216 [Alyxoria varia]
MSHPATQHPTLPPPTTLTRILTEQKVIVSDTLFEHSSSVQGIADAILEDHPAFSSYDEFIAAVEEAMLYRFIDSGDQPRASERAKAMQEELLADVFAAHPRLGEKRVESALSRAEQAQLQSQGQDAGGKAEEEARDLERLNKAYEEKFPGLRYVVFVNGRGRDVIMADMRMRIERGDVQRERREGLKVSGLVLFFSGWAKGGVICGGCFGALAE